MVALQGIINRPIERSAHHHKIPGNASIDFAGFHFTANPEADHTSDDTEEAAMRQATQNAMNFDPATLIMPLVQQAGSKNWYANAQTLSSPVRKSPFKRSVEVDRDASFASHRIHPGADMTSGQSSISQEQRGFAKEVHRDVQDTQGSAMHAAEHAQNGVAIALLKETSQGEGRTVPEAIEKRHKGATDFVKAGMSQQGRNMASSRVVTVSHDLDASPKARHFAAIQDHKLGKRLHTAEHVESSHAPSA